MYKAPTAVSIATKGGGEASLLVVDPQVMGGGAATVRWVPLADLDASVVYNYCWPVPAAEVCNRTHASPRPRGCGTACAPPVEERAPPTMAATVWPIHDGL